MKMNEAIVTVAGWVCNLRYYACIWVIAMYMYVDICDFVSKMREIEISSLFSFCCFLWFRCSCSFVGEHKYFFSRINEYIICDLLPIKLMEGLASPVTDHKASFNHVQD